MSVTAPPPGKKVNRIGLELQAYRGSKTTLCAGCGHNAISERVIDACYELGIDARHVLKLSGIGCSSSHMPAGAISESDAARRLSTLAISAAIIPPME